MGSLDRREFLRTSVLGMGALGAAKAFGSDTPASPRDPRPNILFAVADDWGWPDASIYGSRGAKTPAFDRVAREGCLFTHAYCAAPQCSPNRAAMLTGRYIGQLEEAGTHASIFPSKFAVYPDLLETAGYHVGFTGKGWGPGNWKKGGRRRNPAGTDFSASTAATLPTTGISKNDYASNFDAFLRARPSGRPFCFWFGANEPHRLYEQGSGLRAGKSPNDAAVPPFLPDDPVVKSDLLDYYVEVEWFDTHLGRMLARLEQLGELDRTLVVVTGDNGASFPGAKANLYEYGLRVPLAVRWPEHIGAAQTRDDLVSHVDLAPSFLAAAGQPAPAAMSGTSFLKAISKGATSPWPRDVVVAGRERHSHARYDNLGYPARSIRTKEFLYIRNFKPDRWPAGDPEGYYDIDDSPTKTLMMAQKAERPDLFAHSFGKHPKEELFAIEKDPGCERNLARDPAFRSVRNQLRSRLMSLLREQNDPRASNAGDIFESYPREQGGMRPDLGGFARSGEYNPKYQRRGTRQK